MSKKELTNLLSETNYNLDEKPSETELEMFDKLIGLIKGQKKALTKTEVQDKLRKI